MGADDAAYRARLRIEEVRLAENAASEGCATALSDLGQLLESQGELDKAEERYERALAIYYKVRHSTISSSFRNAPR
jgi:tetratricopeptide (TPR) repeat protein